MTEKEKAAKPDAKADTKAAAKAETKADAKPDAKAAKAEAKSDKKDTKDNAKKGGKAADAKKTDAKATGEKKGNKASQFFKKSYGAVKGRFQAIGKKRAEKKAAAKKAKLAEPKYPFVDKPKKPTKHSAYVHKVVQLDKKDNQFTESKFQKIRKISSPREMNESLLRIGKCLNKADLSKLPPKEADRFCFLLINNYDKDAESLGVGPLNDAYLFALIHRKLGYKIVYLYNPSMAKFMESLEYFLVHTSLSLTIYYVGRDSFSRIRQVSHGIQFDEHKEILSDYDFGKMVGQKWNGRCRIFILHDCTCEGCVFNMKAAKNTPSGPDIEIISFNVIKKNLKPREKRLSQGLLTYYFCKLMSQFPNSTPQEMANMLNISFERFKVGFIPQLSKESLNESLMFPGADGCFNNQPQVQQVPQQASKPTTEAILQENQ